MIDSNSDLWPSDVVVDVLSPLMILKEQAEVLTKRTQGVVKGEVISINQIPLAQLIFDIVAPVARLRQTILSARYSLERPYPVMLMAEPFARQDSPPASTLEYVDPKYWNLSSEREVSQARLASSPSEVRELLKLLFHAPTTRAALFSLIARSNELTGIARTGSEEGTSPEPSPASKIESQ